MGVCVNSVKVGSGWGGPNIILLASIDRSLDRRTPDGDQPRSRYQFSPKAASAIFFARTCAVRIVSSLHDVCTHSASAQRARGFDQEKAINWRRIMIGH